MASGAESSGAETTAARTVHGCTPRVVPTLGKMLRRCGGGVARGGAGETCSASLTHAPASSLALATPTAQGSSQSPLFTSVIAAAAAAPPPPASMPPSPGASAAVASPPAA